jgi:galactonate dehydratase
MDRLAALTLLIVDVTPKTRWSFVEAVDNEGRIGTGEASLLGHEAHLVEAFRRNAGGFLGRVLGADGLPVASIPAALPAAAIHSAIDQALWDLAAQRRGIGLADLLGRKRQTVNVYANINRRTTARSPDAFAESARLAHAAGFTAVKLAPFDGVTPATSSLEAARPGLARIAAVRAALPGNVGVYVDCHWRFTPAVALEMVAALADVGVAWYECPIVEDDNAGPALAALRKAANARGMLLAGREEGVTRQPFELYAETGAYDVMMPDAKYIGGLVEMLETGAMLARYGIGFSPHNHTGPIGHVVSLAAALADQTCSLLEMQFDETPHFAGLIRGALPQVSAGRLAATGAAGLGIALDHDYMQAQGLTVERYRATV